ncbi:MAG: hypothetical protein Q7W55_07980 [Pseudohongiella sp.]|nr:hypothetical protein [Pseudohongiella sp.]
MNTELYDNFSNEVYQATACYVIWKYLQNEPAADDQLLKALNRTPLSWIVFRHTSMLGLIMALGRIFDTDGEAASVFALINSCTDDIGQFSRESLRARKLRQPGANEWIDQYMANVYEPAAADFHKLKPGIRKNREIYDQFYKPLRHNLFAHRSQSHLNKENDLWKATSGANIEEVLDFLNDFDATLRETYNNGRAPVLQGRKINEEWFAKDIQALLQSVKNA